MVISTYNLLFCSRVEMNIILNFCLFGMHNNNYDPLNRATFLLQVIYYHWATLIPQTDAL